MPMIRKEYAVLLFGINYYCTDNMDMVQERYILYPP